MITVYFIWGWKENNLRMFTSVHYIWGRLWTSNHTRTDIFYFLQTANFHFRPIPRYRQISAVDKLNFFSVFFFISLTVVKLVIMIKIFTSRFKSMFPWLLVMPWCRSKILDQSLSRHHACLVGTGHNKGKEKKNLLSREWKKNLRGKSFFYSRWEYCSIIFHTRNFATIKEKLFFFILKIMLFVLVRYKNLMKRAKKTYPTSCRHAKKSVSPYI